MSDCVFCQPARQRAVLFATGGLCTIPDLYPLLPGHTLILTRAHLRCHAEFPPHLEAERDRAVEQVRRFLREAYGQPAIVWENGVAGQTVFHAHLHLLPLPAAEFPAALDAEPEVVPVTDWEPVRAHFARHGSYRYLEFAGERRLLPGHGPAVRAVTRWLEGLTGLRHDGRAWCRVPDPADVRELERRWREWRA